MLLPFDVVRFIANWAICFVNSGFLVVFNVVPISLMAICRYLFRKQTNKNWKRKQKIIRMQKLTSDIREKVCLRSLLLASIFIFERERKTGRECNQFEWMFVNWNVVIKILWICEENRRQWDGFCCWTNENDLNPIVDVFVLVTFVLVWDEPKITLQHPSCFSVHILIFPKNKFKHYDA